MWFQIPTDFNHWMPMTVTKGTPTISGLRLKEGKRTLVLNGIVLHNALSVPAEYL